MIDPKYAVVGLAALGGVALGSAPASAMPNGMPAAAHQNSNVENVVMVCNAWGRCWWRPNYYVGPRVYGYGGYGGPRYHGGYGHGWRRGYRRW
ncbi:MAG: hypothetical protein QOD09_3211 [Bradyrhizobium sp.]|jgi:hypothetical protein|nr:hypothetical protein [Bradyrhizobium sp.]